MLAYQSGLGRPWFSLGPLPLYRPWALFGWWYSYEAYAPAVFNRAGALAGASGFLGCGAAVAGSLWRAREAGQVTTYGSARWATHKEIARAGLLGDTGLFLGCSGGAYAHLSVKHLAPYADQLILPDTASNPAKSLEGTEKPGHKSGHSSGRPRLQLVVSN